MIPSSVWVHHAKANFITFYCLDYLLPVPSPHLTYNIKDVARCLLDQCSISFFFFLGFKLMLPVTNILVEMLQPAS